MFKRKERNNTRVVMGEESVKTLTCTLTLQILSILQCWGPRGPDPTKYSYYSWRGLCLARTF